MKKRIVSLLCAIVLILSCVGGVSAVEARASSVLSGYGVSLTANGNKEMTFKFRVYAPQIVAKLGAQKVEIQRLVDGDWTTYKIFTQVSNPTFYDYDCPSSEHTKTFTAKAGEYYRAVLTAYSEGYDGTTATRTSTSQTVECY